MEKYLSTCYVFFEKPESFISKGVVIFPGEHRSLILGEGKTISSCVQVLVVPNILQSEASVLLSQNPVGCLLPVLWVGVWNGGHVGPGEDPSAFGISGQVIISSVQVFSRSGALNPDASVGAADFFNVP